MDKDSLKELLKERLYLELQLFKDSILQQDKEEIFSSSYKIEIYVNLYEIFRQNADRMDENTIRRLLGLKFGILRCIYLEWLCRSSSFYGVLEEYACHELEIVSRLGTLNGIREEEDGTESDKAA